MASAAARAAWHAMQTFLSSTEEDRDLLEKYIHKSRNQHRRLPHFRWMRRAVREVEDVVWAVRAALYGGAGEGGAADPARVVRGAKELTDMLRESAAVVTRCSLPAAVSVARTFFMREALTELAVLASLRAALLALARSMDVVAQEALASRGAAAAKASVAPEAAVAAAVGPAGAAAAAGPAGAPADVPPAATRVAGRAKQKPKQKSKDKKAKKTSGGNRKAPAEGPGAAPAAPPKGKRGRGGSGAPAASATATRKRTRVLQL